MSYSPPTPLTELPSNVVEAFNDYSPQLLSHLSRYAEELAEYREREARLAEEGDEDAIGERPEELSDDVPSKATIKEINDNRYYYWQ